MSDLIPRIDQLAEWIEEFQLDEVEWEEDDRTVHLTRRSPAVLGTSLSVGTLPEAEPEVEELAPPVTSAPVVPTGTPVSSPMNGIYYSSPSPSSPPFVKEGDVITAGQVVGLIEAMKVFNEIPSPVSGTVLKIAAKSGAMVQPGEALLFIG